MKKVIVVAIIMTLFTMFLVADSTKATTVIKKSFEQVAQKAELIFEGKVLSKETRLSPISGMPFTYFTFKIIDVIKGEYPDPTIEMGFMGGPQGDLILRVSDMRMPKVGERGIYFVEKVNEQQIHPLYSWNQGHYLVITNRNTDIVVPVAKESLELRSRSLQFNRAPTLENFKQNIVDIIKGAQ